MTAIHFGSQSIIPGKLVCVGRNYVAHIEELGNEMPDDIVLFNKPASALTNELRAFAGEALHYEAELSFLIRTGRIVAVALGLDLTKRDLQSRLKQKGLPWERAKAFDGAALLSDFVAIDDATGLSFEFRCDGELLQQGSLELMIHQPATVIAALEGFMALQDNDVLMTGTPAGVGALKAGALYSGTVYQHGRCLLTKEWRCR
ncbi:fumarylacetoacetate hydrolase family protein [Shewanella cyperi]|uniref:fumarylacetoacetate hydrolase family protein n=1 Tax=Shewanella cyperi TaxID=2814292 RepID=UPI001A9460EF|nr:fumarylacetoacetate hydrolase family protein [Shewanella cyperi]QSX39805.1 fumarylacetoacetate hydrolase family protein [Shewanella cyperi]